MAPFPKRPLQGVTVLDLSRLLPGGFCSLILADLGARVIKVEEPGVGDFYRARYARPLLGEAYFAALNRGKESLALNLKSKTGREIFWRLLKKADVVIESFRPGRLKKLGLGYQTLRKRRPDIILCSITGYGQSGPDARQAGHDLNYLARSGLLSMLSGRKVPGFQIADTAGGGLYAVIAIQAALHGRQQSGEGAWLDVSMTEGALSLAGLHLTGQYAQGESAKALLGGDAAHYQVYQTQDGAAVALAALEEKFWQAFRRVADPKTLPKKSTDPQLLSQTMQRRLQEIIQKKTIKKWANINNKLDFCLSPVRSVLDTLQDSHFKARNIFMFLPGTGQKRWPFVKTPLRFNGRYASTRKRPPRMGQQTQALLKELGFSAAQIKQLKQQSVVS